MDILKTLKNVKIVSSELSKCLQVIENQESKAEIQLLISELRSYQEALTIQDVVGTLPAIAGTLPALDGHAPALDEHAPPALSVPQNVGGSPLGLALPLASEHAPTINKFRVLARQQGLQRRPEIETAALQYGVDPRLAVQQVTGMNAAQQEARVQALAANLEPDIRQQLQGQRLTKSSAFTLVQNLVRQYPTVEPDLVTRVARVITDNISV